MFSKEKSGGKPAFLTSSCLAVSGDFVNERFSIKNQPLSSKQLMVRKVGLPPLFF